MNKYVVFDSHCDTASELWSFGQALQSNNLMVSLDRTEDFAGYGQFFAFCISFTNSKYPETKRNTSSKLILYLSRSSSAVKV